MGRNLNAVTAPATGKITDAVRRVAFAVMMTARQLSRRRIVMIVATMVILVSVALVVPLPTAMELRDWATSVGPWFPVAFLLAHIVVTVLPFPRTALTLAAGLLFGPAVGMAVAVGASTASAVIALALVRATGWQLRRLVQHHAMDTLDARLRARGWPAILALRLIPAVPFSVLNYAAGASAVRMVPFTVATVLGLLPGSAAVVLLGDALTGDVNPLLILASLCTSAVGVSVLIFELRHHRRQNRGQSVQAGDAAEPAITTT